MNLAIIKVWVVEGQSVESDFGFDELLVESLMLFSMIHLKGLDFFFLDVFWTYPPPVHKDGLLNIVHAIFSRGGCDQIVN